MGRDIRYTIPAIEYGTAMLHGGATTHFSSFTRPSYEARWQLEDDYTLPPQAGGVFNTFYSTWLEGEWARTHRATPGGYWVAGVGTFADVARRFITLFTPSAPRAFSDSGYHTSASGHTDLNLRAFNGFAVLSHPSQVENVADFLTEPTLTEGLNWPTKSFPYPADAKLAIDPSAWQTYCSDPSALSRFALDLGVTPPRPDRLKYLQLTSST
jgi:hypothetical protein